MKTHLCAYVFESSHHAHARIGGVYVLVGLFIGQLRYKVGQSVSTKMREVYDRENRWEKATR